MKLLTASSSQVLKTSRDGDSTILIAALSGIGSPSLRKIFSVSDQSPLSSVSVASCPSLCMSEKSPIHFSP